MSNEPQKRNSSVFKLTMLYCQEKSAYPVRLSIELLGYYTSLQNAVKRIKRISNPPNNFYRSTRDFAFCIFEVKEYRLNSAQDEPTRHRIYDREGKFYSEYKWWRIFKGSLKKECRFQPKQIVEFLQYNMEELYLNIGIIVSLPPTPQAYKSLLKTGMQLTESENRYGILTLCGGMRDNETNRYSFLNKPSFSGNNAPFVFPTKFVPADTKENLLSAYKSYMKTS